MEDLGAKVVRFGQDFEEAEVRTGILIYQYCS